LVNSVHLSTYSLSGHDAPKAAASIQDAITGRLHHNSQIAGQTLPYFAVLYKVEREAVVLDAEERRRLLQSWAYPTCDALYKWMVRQRKLISEGSAIAKAGLQPQRLGGAYALSR